MENIKNFIEEGEKELEKVSYDIDDEDLNTDFPVISFKDAVKVSNSRQISLIKMIMEMVDEKMDTIPEKVVNERLVNLKNQLLSSLVNGEK